MREHPRAVVPIVLEGLKLRKCVRVGDGRAEAREPELKEGDACQDEGEELRHSANERYVPEPTAVDRCKMEEGEHAWRRPWLRRRSDKRPRNRKSQTG